MATVENASGVLEALLTWHGKISKRNLESLNFSQRTLFFGFRAPPPPSLWRSAAAGTRRLSSYACLHVYKYCVLAPALVPTLPAVMALVRIQPARRPALIVSLRVYSTIVLFGVFTVTIHQQQTDHEATGSGTSTGAWSHPAPGGSATVQPW